MSCTCDLMVAVTYAQSPQSVIFKIVCRSFMTIGADISFLSCFASEREYVFPPLTYLQPTGRPKEVVSITPSSSDGASASEQSETLVFQIVEVEPVM